MFHRICANCFAILFKANDEYRDELNAFSTAYLNI